MMINIKYQISNIKYIFPLLLLMLLVVSGCQSVEKPVRGEEGGGPMTIVIDGNCAEEDAPDYHCKKILENPNSKIPIVGQIFTSGLDGLDFWKANHPLLVTGTHDPVLISDPEATCLDCHSEPDQACNVCHSYVGVPKITASEEEE